MVEVVSVSGKGRARPCQVRTKETNESKPLMNCRKRRNDVNNQGVVVNLGMKSGGYLFTTQMASGMKAA